VLSIYFHYRQVSTDKMAVRTAQIDSNGVNRLTSKNVNPDRTSTLGRTINYRLIELVMCMIGLSRIRASSNPCFLIDNKKNTK
jgi:hypothetical protein